MTEIEHIIRQQRERAIAWQRAASDVYHGVGPDAFMRNCPGFVASRYAQARLETESWHLLTKVPA